MSHIVYTTEKKQLNTNTEKREDKLNTTLNKNNETDVLREILTKGFNILH